MNLNHFVLYRNEARYSSFPTVAKGGRDELWVGFNWNSHTPLARGVEGAAHSHAGGLAGGATGHVELFSPDGGGSWFEEGKDDRYRECPETLRSAVLSDGTRIRISRPVNAYPPERREEFARRGFAVEEYPERIHVEHSLRMSRKRPGDSDWEHRLLRSGEELPFFALVRNGTDLKSCVLADDTILNQVYGSARGRGSVPGLGAALRRRRGHLGDGDDGVRRRGASVQREQPPGAAGRTHRGDGAHGKRQQTHSS